MKEHYLYATKPKPKEKNSFFTTFFRHVDKIYWLENWDYDWMKFQVFYGHTHGMVVPRIMDSGKDIYYVSDLIPLESFLQSGVSSNYDLDPQRAMNEKNRFLNELETPSELILFHDPRKKSIVYP